MRSIKKHSIIKTGGVNLRKTTYLRLKYRKTPWIQKAVILAIAMIFLMAFSLYAMGQLPTAQTYLKQQQSKTYT